MLNNPFSGKELFTYWKDHITFRISTVVEWDELNKDAQQRWNRMASMINKRMDNEAELRRLT